MPTKKVYVGLVSGDPRVVADTREDAMQKAREWRDQHPEYLHDGGMIRAIGATYYVND